MACFDGVRASAGGALEAGAVLQEVQTVRPFGFQEIAPEFAPKVALPALDAALGRSNGPAAVALRLDFAPAGPLQVSLASALAELPALGGRLRGGAVALTGAGVPFSVVRASGSSAPAEIVEKDLCKFAEIQGAASVRRGQAPLLAVRLTRYGDGSSVLGVSYSRAVLDDTSFWTFLARWAALMRGASPAASGQEDHLAAVRAEAGSEGELSGADSGRSRALLNWMVPSFTCLKELSRIRVELSSQEVSNLRRVAAESSADQVPAGLAVTAHLVLVLARSALLAVNQGSVAVCLHLDVRAALGLPAAACFGSAALPICLTIAGVRQMTLAELATALRAAIATQAPPEVLRRQWKLLAGAHERGVALSTADLAPVKGSYEYMLEVQDLSAAALPDFGSAAGRVALAAAAAPAAGLGRRGGVATILPSADGLQVLLPRAALRNPWGLCDPEEVLGAFRAGLAYAAEVSAACHEATATRRAAAEAAKEAAFAASSSSSSLSARSLPALLKEPAAEKPHPDAKRKVAAEKKAASKEPQPCYCGRGGICVCCEIANDW